MQRLFVLRSDRRPLDVFHHTRARQLLKAGRAAVFRRYPFTIALEDRGAARSVTHPHLVKIELGSKVTGIAVVQEGMGNVGLGGGTGASGRADRAAVDQAPAIARESPRFLNRASSRRKERLPSTCQWESARGGGRSTTVFVGGCPSRTGWTRPALDNRASRYSL